MLFRPSPDVVYFCAESLADTPPPALALCGIVWKPLSAIFAFFVDVLMGTSDY